MTGGSPQSRPELRSAEEYAHAILSIIRQLHAKIRTFFGKKFMRCLDHDTCTVAGIVFATARAAMLHVLKNRERIRNDLVRFVSLYVGNETNSAGIMFKRRMI